MGITAANSCRFECLQVDLHVQPGAVLSQKEINTMMPRHRQEIFYQALLLSVLRQVAHGLLQGQGSQDWLC
jgi:hypothetical protein